LPPERDCPIDFLRDILTGKKKYFKNNDIPYFHMQKLEHITIKNVMKKVYDVPDVRIYLPDYRTKPEKHMNRDYLFAILNKLDPSYFNRVTTEVESRRKPKPADENKIETISVKQELFDVLKSIRHMTNIRNTAGDKRAFASVVSTSKKRKLREVADDFGDLQTTINVKRMKI
jgi:hypothetical protein